MRIRVVKRLFCLIILIGFLSGKLFSAELKGNIKLTEDWQPVIFLASINSPENLNVASPDFIISKTFINPDGSFEFRNIILSENPQFYRFYLVKNENSTVEFNLNDNRNFVHFILDNSSEFVFNAEIKANTLKIIDVANDYKNQKLIDFEAKYQEKKLHFKGDLSKAQKEFLTIDLENYIRNFVDSCENTMVGLFALYQIEEKETDFLRNNEFYFNFQKKINHEFPNAVYTEAYNDLLQDLVGFKEMVCEIPGVIPKWKDYLLIIEGIVIFVLLIVLIWVIRNFRIRNKKNGNSYANLTSKEKEILRLLANGKTNKEIAKELFIELSTVKTHINSIYKQLELSNRKEAINYYHSL